MSNQSASASILISVGCPLRLNYKQTTHVMFVLRKASQTRGPPAVNARNNTPEQSLVREFGEDALADHSANRSTTIKRERFDVRLEADETWTIYDIFSGLVVSVGGVLLMELELDTAFYLVDEMNDQDFERRKALGF